MSSSAYTSICGSVEPAPGEWNWLEEAASGQAAPTIRQDVTGG